MKQLKNHIEQPDRSARGTASALYVQIPAAFKVKMKKAIQKAVSLGMEE